MIIIAFAVPVFCSFKNTQVSNNAGNANPSEDKHKAPNNDMNKSSFGIATAKRTAKTTYKFDFFLEMAILKLNLLLAATLNHYTMTTFAHCEIGQIKVA